MLVTKMTAHYIALWVVQLYTTYIQTHALECIAATCICMYMHV